jgi:hypothetical protein
MPPRLGRDVEPGVRGTEFNAADSEALGNRGSDKTTVGHIANVVLGNVLQAIARPAPIDGLDLAEPPEPAARRHKLRQRPRLADEIAVAAKVNHRYGVSLDEVDIEVARGSAASRTFIDREAAHRSARACSARTSFVTRGARRLCLPGRK